MSLFGLFGSKNASEEKVEKENKGFNRSDGIFVETKNGKNKIIVNNNTTNVNDLIFFIFIYFLFMTYP